jgi:carboxymethylenebutenolidase
MALNSSKLFFQRISNQTSLRHMIADSPVRGNWRLAGRAHVVAPIGVGSSWVPGDAINNAERIGSMVPRACLIRWQGFVLAAALALAATARAQDKPPETVHFPSADGKTMLLGYLYAAADTSASHRLPAVVLMHGRAGVYSSNADGVHEASTLSLRHKAWGRRWREAGYAALLVDGFGPRGYPAGFPRHSYDDRPAALDEVAIRPLDAYGALAYLAGRPDIEAGRIGLMGWSNGASATLSAMATNGPGKAWRLAQGRFRAALAFYPGCRLKQAFDEEPLRPYAPVLILHGTADEEVSHRHCIALAEEAREAGGTIEIELFEDATHGFDSPTRSRQALEANQIADAEASKLALDFFDRHVKRARPPAQR